MELKEIIWEAKIKEAVWRKSQIHPDHAPDVLRLDDNGYIMMWSKFGRTDSRFGWTIRFIDPLKEEGLTYLENLQPINIWNKNK
jgi:hypothetical protein